MDSPAKRAGAILVDAVLAAAAPLLVTRRALRSRPRVLLIRCDHLGDGVLATSVLRPVRDALDPERLDVLASPWNASIFESHPAVDDVIVFATPWWLAARHAPLASRLGAWLALPGVVSRIRAREYDIAIDLRGDLRQIFFFLALGGAADRVSSDRTGGRRLLTRVAAYVDDAHEVEKDAAVAAVVGARGAPMIDVDTSDLLTPTVAEPFVALGLSSNKATRRWPLESAAALVRRLHQELNVQLVYVGGPDDRPDAEALAQASGVGIVNAAGSTRLRETVALLQRASAFVTVDAGQLHLGAAAGCPTVALFGQSEPNRYGPWGVPHRILAHDAPCGCPPSACRFADGPRCMRDITADEVFAAVRELRRR